MPTPLAEPDRRLHDGPGSGSARDHAVEGRVVDGHGHGAYGASDGASANGFSTLTASPGPFALEKVRRGRPRSFPKPGHKAPDGGPPGPHQLTHRVSSRDRVLSGRWLARRDGNLCVIVGGLTQGSHRETWSISAGR